jgi:hypothetical protein
MNTKITLLAMVLAATSSADQSIRDIGYFRNQTTKTVLVYLLDRPGHYYAIFGIGSNGIESMTLHKSTVAIVTLVPKGKENTVVLVPEGKQIARTKLSIPPRARTGERNERNLYYGITDGEVRFVSPQDAKDWNIEKTN